MYDRQRPVFPVSTPGRLALAAAVMVLAPAISLLALAQTAERLFLDQPPRAPWDAIVVLGGDAQPRATEAGALWRAGRAAKVIVTGDGDCLVARDVLIAGGVPASGILVDCLSRDTWTNAGYAAPLLERVGARSAVIVTSWFHTARALRTFRLFCPGIVWSTAAAPAAPSARLFLSRSDGEAVALESAKTLLYLGRSWLRPPAAPRDGMRCSTGLAPSAGIDPQHAGD